MTVLVKWTVTMMDYRPRDDEYTGLPTGPMDDVPRSWAMKREFQDLADAQAFIDAAPESCSEWEVS